MNHRKLKVAILFTLVLALGVLLGVYVRDLTLNPLAKFPSVVEEPVSVIIQEVEKVDEDILYHDVALSDFVQHGSSKTKVAFEGIVARVLKEPDGDYHVIIKDPPTGLSLVTEFIPEIKELSLPKEGDRVLIWGITRFDIPHNWWELHPVIGWKKL